MVGNNDSGGAYVRCAKRVLRIDYPFQPDGSFGNGAHPFNFLPAELWVGYQAEGKIRRALVDRSSKIDVRQNKIRGHSEISALFPVAAAERGCVHGDHNGFASGSLSPLNEPLVVGPFRPG